MTLAQIIELLLPQLLLLVTVLAIFIADLADTRKEKGWAPYAALAGILAALVVSSLQWGREVSFLGNMMRVDHFSVFFTGVVLAASALAVLLAISYMRPRTPYRAEFYALLTVVALAMTLAAGASNILMIYLAMESISITSYVLVGYLRQDAKANEAAIKYFLYGAATSAMMLYGMSLLYGISGTLDLKELAGFFSAGVPETSRWIAFPSMVLLLAGFGFKTALVPFHQWSPDTYEGAPTPVTAFLSVGPKAAGFAILMRVFITGLPGFYTDWAALLAGVSIVTMTLGNLVALRQSNIKRMLAYSSIAHAGYILIGVVCLSLSTTSPFNGVNGAMIYLLAYLFTNVGAFLTVVAFEEATGSNTIADYAGLMKRSPWLAVPMLVFLLSLTGIPSTGGFIGKLFVFGSAIQVQFYLLAVVGIINSAISAFYYLNVVRYMFFTPAEEPASPISVPRPLRWVLAICLIMTFVIGLYPQPFMQLAAGSATLLASL
ncbi:MAG: NADH-quinone oxidoreductase subunit N [Anaerolineae bacterium]